MKFLTAALAVLAIAAMVQVGVCAEPITSSDHPFLSLLFTDHMVLQRGIKTPIWGWTQPGKGVTIAVDGAPSASGGQIDYHEFHTVITDAEGKWMTRIGPLPVGGPYRITIRGSGQQPRVLNDVLSG